MSAIDLFRNRMTAYGYPKREEALTREQAMLTRKLSETLSWHEVDAWGCLDGYDIDAEDRKDLRQHRQVAIINSDNLNEKYIYSYPGEELEHGSLFFWKGNYWLLTEIDANDTVYTKGILLQCNHLLKWISPDGVIHEQWCVIEDSTKYLTGEYEDWRKALCPLAQKCA